MRHIAHPLSFASNPSPSLHPSLFRPFAVVGTPYMIFTPRPLHCDAEDGTPGARIAEKASAVVSSVKHVASSTPETEIKRWRKTFDAHAKVEVGSDK